MSKPYLRNTLVLMFILTILTSNILAQKYRKDQFTKEQLIEGVTVMENTNPYDEDPMILVKMYDGLRVSDVLDAMQAIGLQDIGLMDKTIRPLWRDNTETVAHRIYGVAVTFQYLPTNKPAPQKMPYEDFKKWHREWYFNLAPAVFANVIRPGTAVIIDAQGITNTGFVGSSNSMRWKSLGMTGVITNGCSRDTDEIIVERIPVYSACQGGGTRPGRIETGAVNKPITVGGVLVQPGDMIVADGDGVVVIPREYAVEVSKFAWDIANNDKRGRRSLYKDLNMEIDETLKEKNSMENK